jgi:hypothetical protein
LKLLLIALMSVGAYADSISIEVFADRHAMVRERFSAGGEFEYLSSACARVEKVESGGQALEGRGSGPWVGVTIPAADVSYEVVPVIPSPHSCAMPILMPRRAVDSVSITVTDRGSGLRGVSVPQLVADSQSWSGKLPAVPSRVQLEWDSGDSPPASMAGPSGRFDWNFWGLVAILVTWTAAYLLWARRQAS